MALPPRSLPWLLSYLRGRVRCRLLGLHFSLNFDLILLNFVLHHELGGQLGGLTVTLIQENLLLKISFLFHLILFEHRDIRIVLVIAQL